MKQPIPKALKVYMGIDRRPNVGYADPLKDSIPMMQRGKDDKLYLVGWLDGASFMARQMDKKCKKCKWASH